MPDADCPEVYVADVDTQVRVFIDEHRAMLAGSLTGLTEEEARRSLVPSRTTLLGLVKHAVFVERVWFGEAVTGRSRDALGIQESPDASFILTDEDTISSVLEGYRRACDGSRAVVSDLGPDDVLTGNRRGPLPLRWVHLHVLRELAQHCGHADILREQVLAARTAAATD